MKFSNIVLVLLVGICELNLVHSQLGGYTQIPDANSNGDVVRAAKWANKQMNQALKRDPGLVTPPTKGPLTYKDIVMASDQVVEGQINYMIYYTAQSETWSYEFVTKVLRSSEGFYSFYNNAFPVQIGAATPVD
eukprot:TRINITY_DN3217_c0_g1_i1.p4 TRINITY_DN3217_c0_g1~~TRINITY_DN3217_c0_g1_i1.p4  ORF type:complete len:134 (-),score=20.84 TRINITY_DN3217_c0_g1_i1:358-759(-)